MDEQLTSNESSPLGSFADLDAGIVHMRERLRAEGPEVRAELAQAFDDLFLVLRLASPHVTPMMPEVHVVKALAASTRGAIAAYVLVESGLSPEAYAALRNSVELQLAALALLRDPKSRHEWSQGRTIRAGAARSRIKSAPASSAGDRAFAEVLYREWQHISRDTAHSHSPSFVSRLMGHPEQMTLLSPGTSASYREQFRLLAVVLANTVSLLLAIESLWAALQDDPEFAAVTQTLWTLASRTTKTKDALLGFLRLNELEQLAPDAAMLPDSAVIDSFYIDRTLDQPVLRVTYHEEGE